MKRDKIIKIVIMALLLTLPEITFADDLGNGNSGGDVQDVSAAPISDYIPLAALGGLAVGFCLLRRKARV